MANERSSAGIPAVLITFGLSLLAVAQTPAQKDIPTLARETSPSVVRIVIRDQSGAELGTASGFVVSSDGKIVTNYHVVHISGETQAEARFNDGAAYQIQGVLAFDSDRDLAVLKIQATGREFRPLRLGFEKQVQTGEHVVAIGSPLAGLTQLSTEGTVSDGIVSGIREWPDHHMNLLQITAPISPGSSGGALVASNGDVVGVTCGGIPLGQNLNFAVPISYVQGLLVDVPLRSLASLNNPVAASYSTTEQTPKVEDRGPSGSYTGVWQSGRFAVSGAATLTIRIAESTGFTDAEIFLTGGEVTNAMLTGVAHRTGENIWTVELSSKKPKLHIRGIFRGNNFVGDYTYTRFLMLDQGQWILKKE